MRSYCTLFDRNYLYQGVALYSSLKRVSGAFNLYALCMDEIAFETLQKLNLPGLTAVALSSLLTPSVQEVRTRTTHGQFCWVCQPLICEHILDAYGAEMVTYLESDSMFFSDPEILFEEIGSNSVCVVPHNYAPGFDNSEAAGEFCVQFNAFRNDSNGRAVLHYWRENCFRYDKAAPLAYPGQTCLDEWPKRFEGVNIIRHRGAGVAPWNVCGYEVVQRDDVPHVAGVPTVFYHYHEYGRYRNGAHELGNYPLPKAVVDAFYRPYIMALRKAEALVHTVDPKFAYRRQYDNPKTLVDLMFKPSTGTFREYARKMRRKWRGRYNIYPDRFFSGISGGLS